MEITKKSFSDGFSWVLSALKLCLPKAPAFILKSFLASLVFALIFFIISAIGGLLAMIPILGYVISIAVAIVMFVLSLGFYCGFIRAIQTMIDNGNVTFGSFFFALKDTKFLIKIAPFAIIIGLAMSVVSGIIGYLCYLAIIKAESQVLFYVLLLLFVLVMVLMGIYATYALILFVQRNDPKIFATFSDTAKGLSNNILPVVGMYLGLAAVGIVLSLIGNILVYIFQSSPSAVMAIILGVIALVLYCGYFMHSLTSICISSKEIFVENDVKENVETEENTDSENQQ
jgi:hypothetical protein